ncbi:MAG: TatD family hydrolase [Rikenellaceae bacterium]
MIVDTHCHFDMMDAPETFVNRVELTDQIVIGMTNLPSHFKIGLPHIRNKKHVRLALGLHPLLAQDHDSELLLFKEMVNHTSYIGEVGLDFSREGLSTKEKQIESFSFVLDCINEKKKDSKCSFKRCRECRTRFTAKIQRK